MSAYPKNYDVIIAGAGPAGSSAAIHLAQGGARVLLAEQKKFPREKLCGEFISPECLDHFARLGVQERMLSAGGACLTETVFYSRDGRRVNVPSKWFGNHSGALGLSRAQMDHNLLERAREVGVDVLEEMQASGLIIEGQRVCGVRLKANAIVNEATAPVVIDATGRARTLLRRLSAERKKRSRRERPPMVAFKAHLTDARVANGACEIYFYSHGYGGLTGIENGLSNLCFIASAKDVRACDADAERVMRELVATNSRADYTLALARPQGEWLAVSLESFGRREPVPAAGLIMIGDAAAFIDPFSGSGMLMALESGELAAGVITRHLKELRNSTRFDALASDYRERYRERFGSRLRICAMLRRAAFAPRLAEAAIRFFAASERLRRGLARATRRG